MTALTLSMIVKNEQEYLAACLDSVKNVADEIIIVDTGSTDNTLGIAADYNARIYHFNWIDDFSAARNFALSKSSGNWILYLDADERLDEASIRSLKEIKSKNEKAGYQCKVISRNSFNNSSQIMYYTRLFYNDSSLKFKGLVHEQIDESLLFNDYSILPSEIIIEHIGYDLPDNNLKEKAKRNLSYLLKEYSQNASSYNEYQLGNTYQILEDNKKAFEFFSRSVKDTFLPVEYLSIGYLNMAAYKLTCHQLEEAAELVQKGLINNSESPQLYFLDSQIHFRLGNIQGALKACLLSLESNEKIKQGKNKNLLVASLMDPRKIIYQGIYIAVSKDENEWIQRFLSILNEIAVEEAILIQKLITNQIISDQEKKSIIDQMDIDNIQCYLTVFEKYAHSDITFTIMQSLLKIFPQNSKLLTIKGKSYLEAKEYKKAIEFFSEALMVNDKDISAAFLLISALIESGQYLKIPESLHQIEKEFGNIPAVRAKIDLLKIKLEPILSIINNN